MGRLTFIFVFEFAVALINCAAIFAVAMPNLTARARFIGKQKNAVKSVCLRMLKSGFTSNRAFQMVRLIEMQSLNALLKL